MSEPNDGTDYKKMKQLVKIREIREEKTKKEYYKAASLLDGFEKRIQDKRHEIEIFMAERTEEMMVLKRMVYTQAVKGDLFSKLEFLQENTQMETDKLFKELEEMSAEYYTYLDNTEAKYQAYMLAMKGKTKTKKIADIKYDEYQEFLETKEEAIVEDLPFKKKNLSPDQDDSF